MSETPAAPHKKRNEFDDGRIQPSYTWGQLAKDWWNHSKLGNLNDSKVELDLLLILPFFPTSDGKRTASIINTDIGNGDFVHEFYIENTELPVALAEEDAPPRDIVLIHGYGASLGLFIENFDALSMIPGIKIHAIDLPGFGFSSRPKYPPLKAQTKQDIYKNEDWYIDKVEEWRKRRNISRFVLLGHSFGGYLSCAYAMKFNALQQDNKPLIDKLVLMSPVGLDRNRFSLLKSEPAHGISSAEKARQDASSPTIHAELQDQNALKDPTNPKPTVKLDDYYLEVDQRVEDLLSTRKGKFFAAAWRNNYSPFSLLRNLGPFGSKLISKWTSHRFAYLHSQEPDHYRRMHDYVYRTFLSKGLGEFGLTRILDIMALPRLPLLDRCPQRFVKMRLPTLWLYGDADWMNERAGLQMTKEINTLAQEEGMKMPAAEFALISNAGHHLYLDNPKQFADVVFKFIGLRK